MKNFLILILASIIGLAYAETKISAELTNTPFLGKYYGHALTGYEVHKHAVESPKTYFFPAKHYDIDSFYFYKLMVLNQANNITKFTDEDRISAKGSLDLIVYDKKSGYFKFRLSIEPLKIEHEYDSVVQEGSFKAINGALVFNHTQKAEVIIEGQAIFKPNNLKIITFNTSDNDFFELAVESNKEVYLQQKKHIPVTIILNGSFTKE